LSQLPQFQEKGLLENLVESELNKESVRARLLQTSSNPFERPGVDENLLPTFVQQESGFFDTIGQRFARGAAELEPLGGRRFLIESIPEMVADFNRSEQVPGPYLNNNSVFVIDNKQYDPADVRLDDILDNMPPEIEASLNIYGMDRDRLKELQISDGQKFADFYPALMQQIRVSQSLQAYNEQNPILAGVAGGTHFVSNIIADPLFIAGLLFTGGSTTAAREGTKQTSKGLIRASLKKAVDGPSSALLKKIAGDKAKQTILTRSLIVGGGAAAGGIYTTSTDVAAQQYSMELGLIDPDLQTNYAALGIGLAANGLLSEIAYRSATGAKILPVRKILSRNPESTGSLTTAHILAKEGTAAERLGRTKPLNESSDTIVAGDFVQSMVPELYDPDTSDAFVRFLLTDNNLADLDMVKLADYMAQFPDADELLDALTDPTSIFRGGTTEPTLSRDLTPPELTSNLKKSGLKVGSGVVVGRTSSDTSTLVSATVDEITELGLVKITTVLGETRLIMPNEITEFYPAGLPTSGEIRKGTVQSVKPSVTGQPSGLTASPLVPMQATGVSSEEFVTGILTPSQRLEVEKAKPKKPPTLQNELDKLIRKEERIEARRLEKLKKDFPDEEFEPYPINKELLKQEAQRLFDQKTEAARLSNPDQLEAKYRSENIKLRKEFNETLEGLVASKYLTTSDADMLRSIFVVMDNTNLVTEVNVRSSITTPISRIDGTPEYLAKVREIYPDGNIRLDGAYWTGTTRPNKKPSIDLSLKTPQERRVYTLLHEMGHHFLDRQEFRVELERLWGEGKLQVYMREAYPNLSDAEIKTILKDPNEVVANVFAAVAMRRSQVAPPPEVKSFIVKIAQQMTDYLRAALTGISKSDTPKLVKEVEDTVSYLVGFHGSTRPAGMAERPTVSGPGGSLFFRDQDGDVVRGSPILSDDQMPRTRYQRLTDDVEFYDAQVKQFRQTRARKEELKATRLRDKAKAARDTHIEKSFNLKRTSLGDAIRRNMQDIPISAEMNATARIQMISNTLNNVLNERTENRSGIGVMSRFQHVSGKLGGKWLLPRQHIKADIGSDNKVQSLIGFMSGLIDNHGLDSAEVLRNADGQVITPASVRWQEMNDGGVHRVQRESDILKRSGYDMDEAYMQVGMHITKGDPLPKELLPLYKELKPYLDDIGRRGVAARTIDNINPNFMPVKIKQIFNHEVVHKAWTNVYVRKYLDIFNTSFSDSPVNYRALEKAGFIKKADGEWVSRISPLTNEPFFEAVPTKVGQLTPQMLEMYEPLLAQSIKLDAEDSLARRIGKRNDELKDAPEGPLIRTSSVSPLRSRVLLQEIYFDPEVVKSGLVETDIGLINRSYTKATGYNVARDEAMGELFGQPVKYQEVLETLTALSSSNTEATDALRRLTKLNEMAGARFVMDRDFAVLGTVLSNIGATLVAGTLAPTVVSTEIGAQFLRGVVSRGTLVDHVRLMGDAFKKVGNKERLRHLGIAHEAEMRSSRFWHDFSDHLPEDVADNLAVRGSKAGVQFARKFFLEQPATHLAKATAHSLTFAKLHFSRKKFDKIRSGLDFLEANPDNFAGAARAAGLPLGEFRMLKDFGVINKDMLETAEALLEIDSGALFSDASLSKAITQVKNPKTRAKAQDLHNRISRMALVDAEVFVASPKAGDLAATDNAMFNLLVSMQSFGAAFYNNTLTRVGQAPGWKQAGFFGYLVAAEINNQIIREYLYEDKTMEDIRLEWEEAPIKKLVQAVSRVPVQGPMSLPALFGYAIASGRPELGVRGFGGGAVPNMVANSVKAIHDLASSIYTGEPMTDSAKRNARRSVPFYNNWMLRLLEDSE
jgi:hypothetical protein